MSDVFSLAECGLCLWSMVLCVLSLSRQHRQRSWSIREAVLIVSSACIACAEMSSALLRFQVEDAVSIASVIAILSWLGYVICVRAIPSDWLKWNIVSWLILNLFQASQESDTSIKRVIACVSLLVLLSATFFTVDEPPSRSVSQVPHNLSPLLSHSNDEIRFPTKSLSLYSKLSFAWVTPLMRLGAIRPLQESDIYRVPTEEESHRLSQLLWDEIRKKDCQSLFLAVRRIWWKSVIVSGLWKLFNDGGLFSGPIFMSIILRDLPNSEYTIVYLVLLCFCMYLSQVIGAIGEAQYFQTTMKMGMELRSGLMGVIFQKSLKINKWSDSAKNQISGGKLVNMISSDTEQLQQFCEVMHVLWSAPLRIVVSMVMLYYLLGVAAIGGIVLLVSMIPIQRVMVRHMTARIKSAQLFTDERLRLVTEILDGIQLVKCYAWETPFREKVEFARTNELSMIKQYSLLRSVNAFLISAIPVLVAVISFAFYSMIPTNAPLSAVQAFTALSVFGVLRFPLMQLPSVINMIGACAVSVARIWDYLGRQERQVSGERNMIPAMDCEKIIENNSANKSSISVSSLAEFQWPPSNGTDSPSFVLKNIGVDIAPGELVLVVGSTGSGKSSFLEALLGFMPQTAGDPVTLDRTANGVSYCPQSAWILNGSVRENVEFGRKNFASHAQYLHALESAALLPDLARMSDGDLTEIGEKGVNLSGGQKQRISLARAVLSGLNICLLDDPISALDAGVARFVFEQAIVGALASTTRVLVTNRLESVLPYARANNVRFLVFSEGRIVGNGTYAELIQKGVPEFISLLARAESHGEDEQKSADEKQIIVSSSKEEAPEREKKKTTARLTSDEDRQTGSVQASVVQAYTKSLGWFELIVVLYGLAEFFRVAASVWLSDWAGGHGGMEISPHSTNHFLLVYIGISVSQLMCSLGAQLLGAVRSNAASAKLHARMYASVVVAPMKFFASTPIGRMQNRFAKDVTEMDRNLMPNLAMTIGVVCGLIGTMALLVLTSVYTVIAFVPLVVVFFKTQAYYRCTSRELKRMDSISRSPIYAHFKQIQDGLTTVLAFGRESIVAAQNSALIDNHMRFNLAQMSCNRWLGIRLEFFGGAIVLLTALLMVWSRDVVSAGIAGLALSTALQLTGGLASVVRLSAMCENSFNSIERILSYSNLPSEAPAETGVNPPTDWPSMGSICYDHVVAHYRIEDSTVSPVLNDICFTVQGGSKVGVVGRTGAGKTSLILTLFRILEITKGTISIDGVNIALLGLTRLRKALGIIPQDPLVFEGTLRSNIDPFGHHSDEEIEKAMSASHMGLTDSSLPIAHGGSNLSAGQRQQLCLARVVLRNPKILVLDEATSAMDAVTDVRVLETVKNIFRGSTVITIAHRLHTVIESDALLVLDKGMLVEAGPPRELINIPNGVFASMVEQTGSATAQYLRQRIRRDSTGGC